ncbi:zinc-binding dehydrogenase [Rhizobium sp. L1K21]|uniref:zinc-binding dehydrogenase n=1 Tax=Rhizobium sp. L1K21 TaxID=2954933 RepID=UPI0020937ACE|nr:zinc-binding dehydrogenase [Rhizobium sp. L1K21]MCO6184719.1 zinc-binding dehydrogenase [Rhizobium sp. L1K21]
MRVIEYKSFGNPGEVLQLGERPVPNPGPGQIRVKLTMSPIHNHDLWTIRGEYGVKPELPAVGGTEAAGIVDAVGEGVENVKVGQRVMAASLTEAWAEYFLMPAARAVPLPDSVSDEVGCQLIAMPISAMMALEDLGAKEGEWIIQNAATGAVGKTISMICKSRGINVVNVVRRESAVEELAALGITNAVSTSDADWMKKAKALTGGAPILYAIDSVGGKETGKLMSLLGEGGTLMIFGTMGGGNMEISSGDLIFKQAKVVGFWGAKRGGKTNAKDYVRMITELVTLAAQGKLNLPVEEVFGLTEAGLAADASAKPGRKGKIVFKA